MHGAYKNPCSEPTKNHSQQTPPSRVLPFPIQVPQMVAGILSWMGSGTSLVQLLTGVQLSATPWAGR